MDCPECGAAALVFPVEQAYREYLPGDEPGAAICRRCLTLHPASDPSDEIPDFTAISDAFPSNDDAAVPMALMVGLLSSLALYRQEIRCSSNGSNGRARIRCSSSTDWRTIRRSNRRRISGDGGGNWRNSCDLQPKVRHD